MLIAGTYVTIRPEAWKREFPDRPYPLHPKQIVTDTHPRADGYYCVSFPMQWWHEADLEITEAPPLPKEAPPQSSPANKSATLILRGAYILERYNHDATLCALDKNVLISGPKTLQPKDQKALEDLGWSYDPEQEAWSFYTGHG